MVAWSSFESCHKRWQISEWPSYCQAIRGSDRFEFSGRTFRSMSHWKQAGCEPSQAAWIWKVESGKMFFWYILEEIGLFVRSRWNLTGWMVFTCFYYFPPNHERTSLEKGAFFFKVPSIFTGICPFSPGVTTTYICSRPFLTLPDSSSHRLAFRSCVALFDASFRLRLAMASWWSSMFLDLLKVCGVCFAKSRSFPSTWLLFEYLLRFVCLEKDPNMFSQM